MPEVPVDETALVEHGAHVAKCVVKSAPYVIHHICSKVCSKVSALLNSPYRQTYREYLPHRRESAFQNLFFRICAWWNMVRMMWKVCMYASSHSLGPIYTYIHTYR